MKTFKVLAAVVALGSSISAHAYQINDEYVGSKDHGYGDVIGDVSKFDVKGIDVSVSGTVLTVDVYTNFVNNVGIFNNNVTSTTLSQKKGIAFGDLFLSSSWNPYGDADTGYKEDRHRTGTKWTYGFSLDDRWSSTGGEGALYELNGATNYENAYLSNDYINGRYATYRHGQEVAVKTDSATVTSVGSGSWLVDTVNGKVSFTFDIAGTDLVKGDEIAFHWGMTCGNDTIEGKVPFSVPEPGALALMGLGLAAVGLRRRKQAA
ncbi:PEP-CTERM sorting domain-containing protein [Hahella sp. KA22]|uniref:PEP-CTERM sorting domain-containing protein n=1 Tax=Hahella sp. KA22 TaxID=1628392 RepID=UPI000FDDF585|nr:PEP-CTERM sorting domain-containing protein [Hahella sp. KA22]AZZ90201.1 PEP-CTERM sorting domain-containing protein [Hahella sp. KA22]QAY53571.1 PEP-CTERM sorting domain-containing protein [Hahella sp. KA22]